MNKLIDDLLKNIKIEKTNSEPKPDIAKCSKCGWKGPIEKCEIGTDGDWESGYFEIDLCPKCSDGGCIDDYDFSNKQWKKWEKWENECKKNHNNHNLNEKETKNG